MDRRDFLKVAIASVGATLAGPAKAAESNERKVGLDGLPKGPEDIYLLLFENNPSDDRTDDDFIADAANAAGYSKPNQWHTEIMYFNQQSQAWMVMGCRPPTCSEDYPASQLLSEHRSDNIRVNHLQISVAQQVQARKYFESRFQGKPYSLGGPSENNCADVPKELARTLGINGIRSYTRAELLKMPKVLGFLSQRDLTMGQVLQRPSITFPDEFENVGTRLGILEN